MWQTVVLIPNDTSGELRGIRLVEVIWKTVTSLMNRRLMEAITFHDVLHGFWVGRGMGTAASEAKLLQQLTSMREAVLFKSSWTSRRQTMAWIRTCAL